MGSHADSPLATPPESYPCPLCGSSDRIPLRKFPTYNRCADCGLVCNVRRDPPEVYEGDYFTAEEPAAGHRDFESAAALGYDEIRFGEELKRVGPPFGGRRVLDIGSATGSFLRVAAQHGWTGVGVEISDEARAIAARSGVDSRRDLGDVGEMGPFELVTLHHVLEHLADPVATLSRLRELLAPGGRLVIEVPNWRSLERRSMGTDWMDLRPNQHRWHWDPRTLRRACEAADLSVVRMLARGEPIPSLASVLRSVGFPESWLRALRARRTGPGAPAVGPAVPAGHAHSDDGRTGPMAVRALARAVDAGQSRLLLGKRLVVEAVPSDRRA